MSSQKLIGIGGSWLSEEDTPNSSVYSEISSIDALYSILDELILSTMFGLSFGVQA